MNDKLLSQKKIVVLVEDEADLRSLYSEILTDAGFAVEQAPDGDLALDKLKALPWDILLLDIMLPGKDGIGVLKELGLQNPGKKRGPVVMLTNLNSEPIIQESFKFGADGYLIKSEITPDKLLGEIQTYLDNFGNKV